MRLDAIFRDLASVRSSAGRFACPESQSWRPDRIGHATPARYCIPRSLAISRLGVMVIPPGYGPYDPSNPPSA